jgi:hypothetical protein
VRSSIIISMDREQARWLRRSAEAAGLSEEAFVLQLIEAVRATEHPTKQR